MEIEKKYLEAWLIEAGPKWYLRRIWADGTEEEWSEKDERSARLSFDLTTRGGRVVDHWRAEQAPKEKP